MEFIGREKELDSIVREIRKGNASILLYGRRRFGKTSLLREALKNIDGVKVLFTCRPISLSSNAVAFSSLVLSELGLSPLSFSSFEDLFNFLSKRKEVFTLVLDEYQDLKRRTDRDYVDSIFRDIIDTLPDNVSIILSGSSIRLMRALNDPDNPLFQRFSFQLHLREMEYLESSWFYKERSIRDKIILYSVFGGIPLLSSFIDPSLSVEENIIRLFIEENGSAKNYVKSVVDTEIITVPDAFAVLSLIGNGKRKYSEIEASLSDKKSREQLSRTLSNLMEADLLRKNKPINSRNKKHEFYEIANNSIRFYFSYLIGSEDYLNINSKSYFDNVIAPSLTTFVSYRFEDIAKSYFSILSYRGERNDILKIGSYWYDDKERKKNGEFDVAIEKPDGYEIYECKFLKDKVSKVLVEEEYKKVKAISGLNVKSFGIISSSGFEEKEKNIIYIGGEDLYKRVN